MLPNHIPDISLLPDAQRALDRWAGKFFLGLISDGPLIMQANKIRALGLDRRLDAILLTDQWGREFWKPHPRAFETIEQQSGHRGAACVLPGRQPRERFSRTQFAGMAYRPNLPSALDLWRGFVAAARLCGNRGSVFG